MQNEAGQEEIVETQLQEVDDENQTSGNLYLQADGTYTKRVMDDLDALLADLQSTTAHISSYQNRNNQQQAPPPQQQQQNYRNPSLHRQQQQSYTPVSYTNNDAGNSSGGGAVAYPRYNTPNGVVADPGAPQYQQQHSTEYHQYQQQQQQQGGILTNGSNSNGGGYYGEGSNLQPSVVTVKRVSYASSDDGGGGGGRSGSSTPPPLPPPPPSEVLDSLALGGGCEVGPDGPVYEPQNFPPPTLRQTSKGRGERMSALSNNLSELDQLLQDLNSAQFMAEVDRKSSNIIKVLNYLEDQNEADKGYVNEATTVVNGSDSTTRHQSGGSATRTTGGGPGPAVAPKPVRGGGVQVPPQRTSVDNLLDELEGANQPGRFPVEPYDPHYQELSAVTTTTHHNNNGSHYPQQYQQHQLQQQQQQQYHTQQHPSNSFASGGHQHLHPASGGGHYIAASTSSTSSSSSYHQPGQTASTATRELDELMNSLSEFKLQNTDEVDHEPAYAKPVKSRTASATSPTSPYVADGHNDIHLQQQQQQHQMQRENGQLESMLGDLQSDMNRQGVNTKQKGVCAACQKPIVGQVIAALGKTWHVEHFVCAHCEEPLGTRNFYERDGLAYCETDYHHLFAPRCAYCNGPIVDKCIEALNQMWHPEHFFCAQCGRPFGEEDFHEKDGQAYCKEDYFAMFAPKCGGCALPIMENYISALNRQWHPECFVCWECRALFGAGSFFDYEGLPYCETHYHAKKGSLCASCEKPITGRCITAMFKKFHPEHFVCAFCLKQLNKGTFKEQNDKPYCHPCFVKLFG